MNDGTMVTLFIQNKILPNPPVRCPACIAASNVRCAMERLGRRLHWLVGRGCSANARQRELGFRWWECRAAGRQGSAVAPSNRPPCLSAEERQQPALTCSCMSTTCATSEPPPTLSPETFSHLRSLAATCSLLGRWRLRLLQAEIRTIFLPAAQGGAHFLGFHHFPFSVPCDTQFWFDPGSALAP